MKNRKMIALLLVSSLAATVFCGSAYAGRRVKPIAEQLAERAILETPQEKTLRLGEDGKPRVIITSDLEIDDMNSFIHQCLFFNEIDLAGVVVSGSFCHFTGDGEHKGSERSYPEPGRRSAGDDVLPSAAAGLASESVDQRVC